MNVQLQMLHDIGLLENKDDYTNLFNMVNILMKEPFLNQINDP